MALNPVTGFFDSVEDFISFSGGDHAIKKILIANNGIGAVKAIRSIRRWAFETFGNDRMIQFVAMATPDDMRANAEYIRLADEVVDVPGGSNNNNYANVTLICEIAERLKVDAVMPLWGHASENPNLPNSLLKLRHKVTFIGPPAAPMMALGDKIGSTIIAQSAGVPTISWNGDDLRVDYQKEGIPQNVYDQANVVTAEDCLACCERIGYPVMIKASEGGGGKGIRKVNKSEEVLNSYKAVQGEIPGSPIFVMKMASNARHLEVQLLADKHGEAIALSGRDCSVQRRHQKIVEEGPPIAAPIPVFKRMEQAAVALAKTVGYVNAGTVEYLYLENTQEYAFLELNPRLQVEHPVTENILGINLPACQLQVAMGLHLYSIGDIRRLYGRHPHGRDTIDFAFSERQAPPRHCIAVRVTAENPDAGFQPTSGKIQELQFKSAIDVWGYFSVDHSGLIHEFADSQFGHIFASGRDRESARRAMIVALKELQIRGEIRTTIEYIMKMMQSDDFIANRIDTQWLDARLARHKQLVVEEYSKYELPATLVATAGAALKGYQLFQSRGEDFIKMLGYGHVPSKEILSTVANVDLIYQNVKYVTQVILSGTGSVIVQSNQSVQHINIRQLADNGYLLDIDGKNHTIYSMAESGGSMRIILDGHTCIFTPEYDPTKLSSSVAGKLARLLVPDGSHVQAGDAFVEIEVMKMYMPLKALESGIVNFAMSEGAALSVGDIIATVNLDDPDTVVKAEVFKGRLDAYRLTNEAFLDYAVTTSDPTKKSHVIARQSRRKVSDVLEGYYLSEDEIDRNFALVISSFNDPNLPALEVEESLSVLRGRIDSDLFQKIIDLTNAYTAKVGESNDNNVVAEFPAVEILQLLHLFGQSLPPDKRAVFTNQTSAVWATTEQYLYTTEVRVLGYFLSIIDQYLSVEKWFDVLAFTDVVTELRKENSNDLLKVLQLCRSHANLSAKNYLLVTVLKEIKDYPLPALMKQRPKGGLPIRNEINLRHFKLKLTNLSKLRQPACSHVSYAANLMVIEHYSMTAETRRQKMDDAIIAALTSNTPEIDRIIHFKKFLDSNIVIRDLLLGALTQDIDYQVAAMELYIRRIYSKTHEFKGIQVENLYGVSRNPVLKFQFVTKSFDTSHDGTYIPPGLKLALNNDTNVSKVDNIVSVLPSLSTTKNYSFNDLTSLTRSTSNSRLLHAESTDNLSHPIVSGLRIGVFAKFDTLDEVPTLFTQVCDLINVNSISPSSSKVGLDTFNGSDSSSPRKQVDLVNAVHIVVVNGWDDETSEEEGVFKLSNFVTTQSDYLKSRGVRRVTFFIGVKDSKLGSHLHTSITPPEPSKVKIFTFRARLGFSEDRLYRNIEAPHAFHLDLPRLSNFTITLEDGVNSTHGNVHLYRAVPRGAVTPVRFFARLVSFADDIQNGDVETLFLGALDQLNFVIGREEANKSTKGKSCSIAGSHIFVNIANPDTVLQPDAFEAELNRMWEKHWYRLVQLSVTTVEFKVSCRLAQDAESISLRFVATNPTGFVIKTYQYFEASSSNPSESVFRSIGEVPGPWEGLPVQTPYPVSQPFEKQRSEALTSSDTLYVYDWPILFESAAQKLWVEAFGKSSSEGSPSRKSMVQKSPYPADIIRFQELVVCGKDSSTPLSKFNASDIENGVLLPISREPGLNSLGMVAWLVTIKTPEYPSGRDLVIISNDITHQAGSFGTKEDHYFYKASEYARCRGIPRIYLAANSGARIGMAESLKKLFQVTWQEETDPSKGFKYIYLKKDDYDALLKRYNNDVNSLPVIVTPIQHTNGEERYVITDIIGEEADLGVENLMGSGLIAGATARAYDEIFTLTLVTGRTVGIGAYLVRLGQRTIQKTRNAPIILTGYQALNKLMGRDIYTTNEQLGGTSIMYPNGVSHLLAETHMDSVLKALNWLSFVPAIKGNSLPVRSISWYDSIERSVDFYPPKSLPYDPRYLVTGVNDPSTQSWQSGFLDKDSFVEALSGWAKTVVVGRGRLGGIPLGVIITENRTSEALKPADPADETSHERLVQQAGGVWFPDSSYKTAQALRDFNRECLPCIVFANWRGFSGGQRDMFDEVLKFGSMIVDALVAYQQPLFVYIPPFAELRGGAWVVVDSTINADVMEFYAAENARGGVLEAAGAASIKFRDRDIIGTAHRLDHQLQSLDAEMKALKDKANSLASAVTNSDISKEISDLDKQIKKRERAIFGVYQQVAVHFADLHDTPGRMKAKGVIRRQVQWSESRRYFFKRLKRRLLEFEVANKVLSSTSMPRTDSSFTEPQISTHAVSGFRREVISAFKNWLPLQSGSIQLTPETYENDDMFLSWVDNNRDLFQTFIDTQIAKQVTRSLTQNLREIAKVSNPASGENGSSLALTAIKESLNSLTPSEKAAVAALLQKL